MAPDVSGLREQLQHRCTVAIRELGSETAQYIAKAAGDGALSGSRVVFPLIDALETHWGRLVDDSISDARAFEKASRAKRTVLAGAINEQLAQTLPRIIEVSKVDRSRSGFPTTKMLPSVADRVAALGPYLDMKIRQYQQEVGDPPGIGKPGWLPAPKDVLSGLIVAAILALGGIVASYVI